MAVIATNPNKVTGDRERGAAVLGAVQVPAKHKAFLNHLHIAPRKVRLIANTIRGMRVQEAEAQLMMRPQRAAQPLLKLLRSAIANAVNNKKVAADTLFIDGIWVDSGPMMKRSLPRAMGRATPIHKKSSHVTVILAELATAGSNPRFAIEKPKKKEHDHPHKPAKKGKRRAGPVVESSSKPEKQEPDRKGFLKKMFNRKSV